jgi:hypothetical protein
MSEFKAALINSKNNTFPELQKFGREIEARVKQLEQYGGKAVDMKDSIEHILRDVRKRCADDDAFEAFKKRYCPKLGKSRTYELLAIEQGKKTLDQIRSDTRKRVADHRAKAKEKPVTENPSVTDREEKADVQPGSDPDDQSNWTEEDIAAQIARDVEESLAEWKGQRDVDAIRDRVLDLIKFKPTSDVPVKEMTGSEEVPAAPKRGRPKNKPKPEAAPAGNTGDAEAEAEAQKAKYADDTPPPATTDVSDDEAQRIADAAGAYLDAKKPAPTDDLDIRNMPFYRGPETGAAA